MFLKSLSSTPIISIDQKIAEFFNNNFGLGGDWSWGNLILSIIALILTIVLTSVIGMERERRGRSAGLRTHLLVAVGSCIVMLISAYGFQSWMTFDVTRMAASVVAGVGFLGAGAIIHNHGSIKGLTTASTIWVAMAIGLACGSFNFIIAIAGTILAMVVLVSFRKVERDILNNSPMIVVLSDSSLPITTSLLNLAKEFNCNINDMANSMFQNGNESFIETTFKIAGWTGGSVDVNGFVAKLSAIPGVKNVDVLNHH